MCTITLKGLDFDRVRSFLKRASDKRLEAPERLLYAWMAFKFYYGTYCVRDEVIGSLYKHAKPKPGKEISEYQMLMFLADQDDFRACYEEFKQKSRPLFKRRIDYPIDKMHWIHPTKESEKISTSFANADVKTFLDAMYTITNNLFLGHKDPFHKKRDHILCDFGLSLLVPFLKFLLSSTTGEVITGS